MVTSIGIRLNKRYGVYILILLLSLSRRAYGQGYVYVNTHNLILRDRPEKIYMVLAILHPPCKLKVEPCERFYINNTIVKHKFYEVSISYKDDKGIHHYVGGWVEKRYVVTGKDKITAPGTDMGLELNESEVKLIPGISDDRHDPNKFNAALFPAPKYKGGEKQPAPFKRIYHKGPKGGCYYVNQKGKKVYVDKHFCKGK